ncbi:MULTISPECIES: dihydrolipoyl dehydrogenase [unclassified Bacillus (in: firmicutes)]|uniref:dihydrolipoyl dehydrogenase n=1 Tax=unclassified Bacillus (in: firmicutes) TaxID=185979 RepID=UPI000D04167B|nr:MULTISPECIES: dihydrolipoyl dehydrogenase [unclassified Bacillus (in: firmicutes)]PRS82912.1 dihydrolipoyl dehydrogenase [Bacillus sp. CJCL2]PRS87660.1 dihydrolipoyl dehydrogenase [Bacillus sp. YBWC18]
MTKTYDLTVIGGGPGGYTAALQAAERGRKVALIEEDFLGGTCLNRGCIPSKTLLKHAEVIESIEKAKSWGIETGDMILSFDKMRKRKDDVIEKLRGGIAFLLKQGKIDVYNGRGTAVTKHRIEIEKQGGSESIETKELIIATGSTPAIPPIPGLGDIQFDTSDTIFDIPDIPASVVIIGGGVIGLELACIFQSLQSKVTIIEAAPSIIPQEDEEASKLLERELKKKGIHIAKKTTVTEVTESEGVKAVHATDDKRETHIFTAERLLVCVGRRPNVSAVSQLDLQLDGPFIKVNDQMQTSAEGVYAVGDVAGGYQLAHAAMAEATVAVSNICGVPEKMNADIMPRCIYTLPEVASVGLTEKEAKAKGLSVQTERFDLAASGKALAAGVQSGFIKLVYDTAYGEVIGATMVGPHVTEMISEASSFMYLEGTAEEMAKMIHPHPTISEGFYEAALDIVSKLRK